MRRRPRGNSKLPPCVKAGCCAWWSNLALPARTSIAKPCRCHVPSIHTLRLHHERANSKLPGRRRESEESRGRAVARTSESEAGARQVEHVGSCLPSGGFRTDSRRPHEARHRFDQTAVARRG